MDYNGEAVFITKEAVDILGLIKKMWALPPPPLTITQIGY
jgi:hypothetical protein